MRVTDLIQHLNGQGIYPYLESGKLKTRSDRAVVDADLVRMIRDHKDALVAFLAVDDGRSAPITAIEPLRDRDAPVPLSFAQQRLWFIDQLEGGSAQYNINVNLELSGVLDLDALQRTLDVLVERHDVLRTRFVRREDDVLQSVGPAVPVAMTIVDLSALQGATQADAVETRIRDEAVATFDLSSGVLLRATVLRLAAQRHVVLFATHHIASDGWSKGLLLDEFCTLYAAHSEGRDHPLPKPVLQYRDYAAWQRTLLQGEFLETELAWWTARLHGAPPVHALPLRQPRPAQQQFVGGLHETTLDATTVSRIRAMCATRGMTPFVLLQTVFAMLLARFGGEPDVVMGTPVSGRVHPDVEPLVGFFVNTLVLRTRVDPDMSFEELLTSAKDAILDAFAHQTLPFEMVVDAINPERSLGYSPLFQVLFSYHGVAARRAALELPGLRIDAPAHADAINQFDIEFNIGDDGVGMTTTWSYNRTLFDADAIARMAEGFAVLLDAGLEEPTQPVGLLPVLGAIERARIVDDWNATATPASTFANVHGVFERQVADAPQSIAAIDAQTSLDFASLNRQANRIAHHLLGQGVGMDARVGICLRRGVDMLVALVAVLKTGAAYVPLDPDVPVDRLRFMLRDARIDHVLTHSDLMGELPFDACEVLPVDLAPQFLRQMPDHDPGVDGIDARSAAYVIYTSGSTGAPKGVEVTHGGVLNYLDHAAQAYLDGDVQGGLVATPFAFDATVTTLLVPACVGQPAIFLADDPRDCMDALCERLHDPRPWLFKLTPAHLDALAILASAPSQTRHVFVVGGEQLTVRTLMRLRERVAPQAIVINEYGPTETVVGCTTFVHRGGDAMPSGDAVPIGQPIRNTQVYVLDGAGAPVPPGVTGELHIAGAGVALGYVDQPALTGERFVGLPWAPDVRAYRSGDLVRWCGAGVLAFVGRADNQLKINGFRIESGEIEAQLGLHCEVEACAVAAHEDVSGIRRLVAYVVPALSILHSEQDESELDRWRHQCIARMREHLQQRLPGYMVPSAFVLLDALPLTANHKVDRAALPAPDVEDFEKESFVAPRDAMEQALAGIWQEVLRLDAIGIDDHFFRLGGHSLLATRVASEIARALDRQVPVRALFEHPTVRTLAAHLATQPTQAAQPIERVSRDAPLPLSFAQQRLWFIDRLEGGSRQYHIATALRLEGLLDRAVVQRALDAIVARHEVLRTRFVDVQGDARQCIDPPRTLRIAEVDLRDLAGDLQDGRVSDLIDSEASAPFDLAADAMLRCTLLRLADDVHVALLTMHHIASDGWSTSILVREFAALYEAFGAGRDDPLPALPVQYADVAHWQRQALQGEALDQHLGYWRQQLAGVPRVHALPLDRPRPAQQNVRGGVVEDTIDPATTAVLDALARDHDASLFMVLQGAFAVLLGRWSHETDVVIGAPVAGRTHVAVEPLIGFFINSLVLRTDLSGNPSFTALLARVRQVALDAYAHQSVPFDMLVDTLKPDRSLEHAPLFQVSLSFHNLERAELQLPGLAISDAGGGQPVARYDIELHIGQDADGLHVRWVYARSLFDTATIERLAESFRRLLGAIAASPAQPIDTLDLLPRADAERLDHWSHAQRPEWPVACAHALFEAHADRAPDALAVVCDGESLRYGELEAQANQVAHYLTHQGVRADALVGLCVERSVDMLVGVLGILKAGAAYLPLDPTYPEDRLAHMLDDAGVVHVLTQSAVLEALPMLGERSVLPLDAPMRASLLSTFPQTRLSPSEVDVRAHHLAYAIYTSGSTGMPKGVLLEHRGLVNLAMNQQALFDLSADSRVLAFASLSFDGAAWEWLMALASGASLHVCQQEDRRSAERLSKFLVDARITHAAIPPALLAQVDADRGYALQVLIVSGEACEEQLAWRWAQRRRVCNSYGPSEATVAATHADILDGQPITLGRALANVELHVWNAHGQPQPIGVPGELVIGGAGLARGYLGRPALETERFVAHPTRPGERLYRTGDMVAWRPDGELQFLGRFDDQVKIRGFRIEPGEVASQLLTHPQVQDAVVVARIGDGVSRLVAYVVCDAPLDTLPNEVLLAKQWRAHLRQRLPDYMVPAAFVVLERLPLTGNGKIDKRRLPEPDYQSQQVYAAPEDATQAQLAQIWQQVLRIEQIGIHDNFFEIGGDSILSIQIVSRANQAGIGITTKQLFEAQTIAELSRLASTEHAIDAPQDDVTGSQPLLPIHHLFLTCETRDRHHYNQAVLLQAPDGFDATALTAVIESLYRRHDALRLRFEDHEAQWHAAHALPDASMVAASCIVETLPADAGEHAEFITSRCTHWQRSFDLARGPLLRAVYFAPSPTTPDVAGRLLLCVHHIVVDGVSWRILLADVEQAYHQHLRGESIRLEPKTSSFQQWGHALAAYARGDALQREKAYWMEQCAEQVPPLPVDRVTAHLGAIATTRTVAVTLSADETLALQQHCHGAYRTQINELLLAGVYLGMRAWTGECGLRIRLEGHGREPLFEQLDTTQTVGWFTSVYPLTLRSAGADVGDVVKAVKEQVRAIPHHGIGYGVLRYLARDADLMRAATSEPELEFNYLGQFDQVLNAQTAFQAAAESVGEKIGPARERMHQLGLSGKIFAGQLHFVLDYSHAQYDDATMQRLAGLLEAGLRSVIEHCRSRGAGGYTPSDFPLARVDQGQLDVWQACHRDLARLYPATPMQAGLLFESLLEPSTYVVQTCPVLRGQLDVDAFRSAWQRTIDRHDIFRTAFVGEGDGLHQWVQGRAVLPWHEEDWRGLAPEAQRLRFDAYRLQDRQAGFDFAQPPLLRIALFRLSDDRYQLLWTHHHMLSDGWSSPLVYRDVIAFYQACVDGQEPRLGAPPVYEHYIAWLQRQDHAAARAHWHAMLGDIDAPTALAVDRLATDGGHGDREQLLTLSKAETDALQAIAQRRQTTVNTLVQWCWAYLLHRYGGETDVVFGATVSGRAAEVPGVEDMVGLFINTIPVRVTFDPQRSIADAIAALHHDFQRCNAHGFLSLLEIQRQSAVPAGVPLFDSLLVFENLPIDAKLEAAESMRASLEVEASASHQTTHYALTLIANLGVQLHVRVGYRAETFASATIERLIGHFARVLRALPDAIVHGGGLATITTPEEREAFARWNATHRDYPRDAGIHHMIEAQARRTPDATALVMHDQRLSYRDLEARATRVACDLAVRGAAPGIRVGLLAERSFDLVVGVLAVLKTGSAYVPLDPGYPQARLDYMLDDSGARIVLTQSHLRDRLDASRFDVVVPDIDAGIPPEMDAPDVEIDGATPAVLMYTSGSTGTPKGVELPHRTIVNLMTGLFARHALLAAPLPTLQFATMNFDMSLYEIASALFTGAPLILIDDEARLDSASLVSVLQRERVGRIYLPTAMLAPFAHAIVAQGIELPALKLVQVAGEALTVTPAIRTWAAASGCQVLNLYGPTESHVVSDHLLAGDPAHWPNVPPIGAPIPNVRLYVVDEAFEQTPIGVVGDLLIAGDGLALGYAGRADLTDERFSTRAIGDVAPQRLYRTGDRARWRADGVIEYVGRADMQVKLRGFRVEPGEIEAALTAHPDVTEAVVVARGEGSGKRLVAYVAGAHVDDTTSFHDALRTMLERSLPHYMVPSAFVSLHALPLNANGKVDRRALPVPAVQPDVHVPPATQTERRLAAIWCRVLKLDEVGANARFFEMGGHSLLATQVVSAVLLEFGCALKIRDVFAYQTVADLAALIDALAAEAARIPQHPAQDEALEEMEW